MIQRIQTVYLFIAAALSGLGIVMNWSTYVAEEAGYVLSGWSCTIEGVSAMPLTLSLALGVVLSLVVLSRFNHRKLQMQLCNVLIAQLLTILGLFGWVHYQAIVQLEATHQGEISMGYGVAIVLPVIAMVLVWLAKKAIKKDDDLIKSVDRLR